MPSLVQICESLPSNTAMSSPFTSPFASPMIQACQLPRSAIDHLPLPAPLIASAFDSGWELLGRESEEKG